MKRFVLFLSSFVFLTTIACSINDSENGAIAEDEQEINLILQEEDLVFDELDEGDESSFGDMDPNWEMGKASTDDEWPVNVRPRFGRVISERNKEVTIIFDSDTTAQAHVSIKFLGKFVSMIPQWSGDSSTSDTLTWKRIQKRLEHDVKRVVNFAKYTDQHRDTSRVHPNRRFRWHVKSVSLSEGHSNPSTVDIVELVIKAEGHDEIVISNPLEFFINRKSIPDLQKFSEVKVQVKVENLTSNPLEYPAGSGSYESLRLHYGLNRFGHHARKSFKFVGVDDHGYQIYEGKWTIRQIRGTHHAIIDLIDYGTIFSPDAEAYPYSSASWSMPYVVTH